MCLCGYREQQGISPPQSHYSAATISQRVTGTAQSRRDTETTHTHTHMQMPHCKQGVSVHKQTTKWGMTRGFKAFFFSHVGFCWAEWGWGWNLVIFYYSWIGLLFKKFIFDWKNNNYASLPTGWFSFVQQTGFIFAHNLQFIIIIVVVVVVVVVGCRSSSNLHTFNIMYNAAFTLA